MPTRRALLALLPALAAVPTAQAQSPATLPAPVQPGATAPAWAPTRPVRLLVGFPPGGAADLLARRLADGLSTGLGHPVVVENRPGANAHLALDAVAKAVPDGHAIALSPMGPLAVNPALMPARMPFDAGRDFTALVHVWDQPNVIVAGLDVPAAWPEFLAWLRSRPEEHYASVGPGSSQHLTGALLSRALGLRMEHVAYRGSPAALTAIMSGEIKLYMDSLAGTIPLARAGRVRAIAVTTEGRSAALPEVPSLAELGLPEVTISSWQVVVGPARMPAPIVARLNAELNRVIRGPDLVAWMRDLGAEPVGGTAEAAAAMLARERDRWQRVMPTLGVTVD